VIAWLPTMAAIVLGADCFTRVAELKGSGDYRAALEVAENCDDALARAQSKLWLLYNAGDPESALRTALAGLMDAPQDTWLLERASRLAVDLRALELAQSLTDRFEAAIVATPDGPAQWLEQLTERRREVDELETRRASRTNALARARLTVGVLSSLAVMLLLWLSWRSRLADTV